MRNESVCKDFFVLVPNYVIVVTASFGLSSCDKYETEHDRYDPKDGELYLRRVKPGETLVEARSDTDVQIVRLT